MAKHCRFYKILYLRPSWKVLGMNTYICNFHQLKYVDLTVTIEIFAAIILHINPSFRFLFFLSLDFTRSQMHNLKCFKHQTLTIWTVPELLRRIFLCLFLLICKDCLWFEFFNTIFSQKKSCELVSLAEVSWLTVAEWGRQWSIFDDLHHFSLINKILQMLVIGNWCKFVCFKVRAAWSLIFHSS